MPETNAASVSRYVLGSIVTVPDPGNRSGKRSIFETVRPLSDEELSALRRAIQLVGQYGGRSVYPVVGQLIAQTNETCRRALGEWRDDEDLPNVSHVDGIRRLVQSLAQQIAAVERFCDVDVPSLLIGSVAAGGFEITYLREPGQPRSVHLVTRGDTVDLPQALESLRVHASECWCAALIAREIPLREAALCIRRMVVPVLDGQPIIWNLPPGQPVTSLTFEQIDEGEALLVMRGVADAKAITDLNRRSRQPPKPDTARSGAMRAGPAAQQSTEAAAAESSSDAAPPLDFGNK